MKTATFLNALRSHAALPLVFRAQRAAVEPGYHLTEVKRVAYETMDCGALKHRWAETQFEIWVPAGEQVTPGRGHMPAEKFLRIVERVEAELPLDGQAPARIHIALDGQLAALYDVETITVRDGKLWVELAPDRTRCKAAERRGVEVGAGCCAPKNGASTDKTEEGCGCSGATQEREAVACCA